MKTGIYQIRNLANGRIYIGSAACSFQKRWNGHVSRLNVNQHHSPLLQNAWNKNGKDAFVFEVIEKCEPEHCIEREQHHLDQLLFANKNDYRFHQLGYNVCRVAGSTLGVKPSNETRHKMSQVARGKKRSTETRQRMSLARQGTKHSKVTKQKIGHSSKLRNAGEGNPMFGKFGDQHPASKVSNEERAQIRSLYLTGHSIRGIARILGYQPNTVRRYIHTDEYLNKQQKEN